MCVAWSTIASTGRFQRLGRSSAGASCSISRYPPSTVMGVRSSCETLLRKSRRTRSIRTLSVTSRHTSRNCPAEKGTRPTMTTLSGAVGAGIWTNRSSSPRRR